MRNHRHSLLCHLSRISTQLSTHEQAVKYGCMNNNAINQTWTSEWISLFARMFSARPIVSDRRQQFERSLLDLCQKGHLQGVSDVLHQMDMAASVHSYLTLLKACTKFKALAHAQQIYAHLSFHQVPLRGILGDYMVVTLAKCGAIDEAKQLMGTLDSGTIFSWNAVISSCVDYERSKEALELYECMRHDAINPDNFTYVSLFKACGNVLDHQKGWKLHADARTEGFTSDKFVCTTLISMYGKFGEIAEAENVFKASPEQCTISWNALLCAYVDHGDGESTIKLYRQMVDEGFGADEHTFVFALRACCILAEKETASKAEGQMIKLIPFEIGQALHADACKRDLIFNVHIGTTLLAVYSKSGDVCLAEYVFSQLVYRNAVSWNAIISAFVENRKGERALIFYRKMLEEGLMPQEFTYVSALQACGVFAGKGREPDELEDIQTAGPSLTIGQALHSDIQRDNFASSTYVATALLGMYGKCGDSIHSEDVFLSMPQRDVVAWNAMLTLFIEQGNGMKALRLFWQMQKECRISNELTFVLALQACVAMKEDNNTVSCKSKYPKEACLEIINALHADARRLCCIANPLVCNTLISAYGKAGAIEEAEHVCGALSNHSAVTENAMLSAYVDCDQGGKALMFYGFVCKEYGCSNLLALVIALQACSLFADSEPPLVVNRGLIKPTALQVGQALHNDAHKQGFVLHPFVGTALLSMYAKCEAVAEAEALFKALSQRDVVSWNALLSAYVEQGQGIKALQLYRQMQGEGPSSSQVTLAVALQACSLLAEGEDAVSLKGQAVKVRSLDLGKALHADAKKEGYASELAICNTLMSMYGKCGALGEVEDVFHTISDRNIVSFNVLLSMCIEQGLGEKAFWIYKQIQSSEVVFDDITLTCMLQACAATGSLDMCKQLNFIILCAGCDQVFGLAVTLIHAYGSCAGTLDGHTCFAGLTESNIASWNAYVGGYAGGIDSMLSLQLLCELQDTGIAPDAVTCTSVISACTHDGLVSEGLQYFESMIKDYSIDPDLQHYGSMLDLLGRVGDFKRLQNLLKVMPKQANMAMWLCLLGACRVHGNLQVGEDAFNNAVIMQPEDATSYVMMSNVYATSELW